MQWRSKEGQVWSYTLDAGFGGAPTHYAVKQNCVFKQKFRSKYA